MFKPSLSAMNYDNNTLLNAVMETLLRKISACQVTLLYKVPYRSILKVTTALEYIQEQRFNPLVENGSQQQKYRWVRKHILLPSGRGRYADWEIFQSVEERILLKSSCAAIQDNFGVPKTSVQRYLTVIFPPLKCSLLKHLWYIVTLGKISNKTLRKRITENIVKQELVHKSYILRDKEAYIVATT